MISERERLYDVVRDKTNLKINICNDLRSLIGRCLPSSKNTTSYVYQDVAKIYDFFSDLYPSLKFNAHILQSNGNMTDVKYSSIPVADFVLNNTTFIDSEANHICFLNSGVSIKDLTNTGVEYVDDLPIEKIRTLDMTITTDFFGASSSYELVGVIFYHGSTSTQRETSGHYTVFFKVDYDVDNVNYNNNYNRIWYYYDDLKSKATRVDDDVRPLIFGHHTTALPQLFFYSKIIKNEPSLESIKEKSPVKERSPKKENKSWADIQEEEDMEISIEKEDIKKIIVPTQGEIDKNNNRLFLTRSYLNNEKVRGNYLESLLTLMMLSKYGRFKRSMTTPITEGTYKDYVRYDTLCDGESEVVKFMRNKTRKLFDRLPKISDKDERIEIKKKINIINKKIWLSFCGQVRDSLIDDFAELFIYPKTMDIKSVNVRTFIRNCLVDTNVDNEGYLGSIDVIDAYDYLANVFPKLKSKILIEGDKEFYERPMNHLALGDYMFNEKPLKVSGNVFVIYNDDVYLKDLRNIGEERQKDERGEMIVYNKVRGLNEKILEDKYELTGIILQQKRDDVSDKWDYMSLIRLADDEFYMYNNVRYGDTFKSIKHEDALALAFNLDGRLTNTYPVAYFYELVRGNGE